MTASAILKLIVRNWKLILISFAVALLAGNVYQCQQRKELRQDRDRIAENFDQAQKDSFTYMLTKSEFKELLEKSNTRTAKHVDSLLKANKINVKNVTEVHNITNTYKDTNIVKIDVPVLDEIKQISPGDKCWGFKGVLTKNDLTITDKWANSEIDIVDHSRRKTKVLFFRVGKKEPKLEAFSDCGEVTVRTIKKGK